MLLSLFFKSQIVQLLFSLGFSGLGHKVNLYFSSHESLFIPPVDFRPMFTQSLKPEMERRRRERINRSLESLKTLLMHKQVKTRPAGVAAHWPHGTISGGKLAHSSSSNSLSLSQEATQRRVEKAEILEHTVLFLQTQRQGAPGGGGGQAHTFQDGFSSCLKRASRFLGPDGKGVLPGSALEASLAARVSRPHCSCADLRRSRDADHPSSSALLSNTSRSLLRFLVRVSGHRSRASTLTPSVQKCDEVRPTPTNPRRPYKRERRVAEKRSPSRSQQAHHLLWRPWP